jgi:hypothetical protein
MGLTGKPAAKLGSYLLVSMALMVCRETSRAPASSFMMRRANRKDLHLIKEILEDKRRESASGSK